MRREVPALGVEPDGEDQLHLRHERDQRPTPGRCAFAARRQIATPDVIAGEAEAHGQDGEAVRVVEGGTIDASPFRDADGKLYLYYKSDGNAVGKRSIVWGQRLSDDGQQVVGEAVPLIQDDQEWEFKLVEAPAMVKSPGGYQMFYSAAYFGWDYPRERLSRYATGYATCTGPLGPCKDAPENPILNSFNDREAGCLSGPGHPAIFKVGERHFLAFHAWAARKTCRPAEPERFLYIAPLLWQGDTPKLGPSLRPVASSERG